MTIDPGSGAAVLQGLVQEVRDKTLFLLEHASANELLWAPKGTSNHLLWHAGHALWAQDRLCIEAITGTSELPAGWADTFGMRCRPVARTKEWPSRGEVVDRLKDQLPRLLALIGALAPSDLESAPKNGDARPLWRAILHGLHDEANHQGEMYLLLKLHRFAS